MEKPGIAFFFLFSMSVIAALVSSADFEPGLELLLDKSGPYIGTDFAQSQGHTGRGVVVAVIDTGVDFAHPDLSGFAGDGKVIGGHNFVSEGEPPSDKNGHGTQVAGIIAADGNVSGIAPKAKILSYKVSDDGESVSSELIVRAIKMAIEDQADIINISLGVNKTNPKIDSAVNEAIGRGILVVVAAGNDGPLPDTIGSPGRNQNAITVGATHNNITSSLVSTFEIGDRQYQVIPMLGIGPIPHPVEGKITDGGYGRQSDLDAVDAADSILLVERGSDIEEELVYFVEKESNSADAGARAVIVYNDEPGMYLGDVSESFVIEDYRPRIPIVSLSQKDGLEIKGILDQGPEGVLNVFYNPDYVAFFSSRGPASPFYIKPDLVAPGTFVNSTDVGGMYNFSSGTSFATPHVSGAAALLLERHPGLQPGELKSILTTTSVPVTDAYGNDFPAADAGAGRLDVENAFRAKIIAEPAFAIMTFSPAEREQSREIVLNSIEEGKIIENVSVEVRSPENIETGHSFENQVLEIRARMTGSSHAGGEGKVVVRHEGSEYRIPLIFRYAEGSIAASEDRGLVSFAIGGPEGWKYAKVSVINTETSEFVTTSLTPKRDSSVRVAEPGEYWIEASISVDDETHYAYDAISIEEVGAGGMDVVFSEIGISERPIYIVAAITAVIAAAGVVIRGGNGADGARRRRRRRMTAWDPRQ